MIFLLYLLLVVAYLVVGRTIVLKLHNRYFLPAADETAGAIILLWPCVVLVGMLMYVSYVIFFSIGKLFSFIGKSMISK